MDIYKKGANMNRMLQNTIRFISFMILLKIKADSGILKKEEKSIKKEKMKKIMLHLLNTCIVFKEERIWR